MKYTEELDQVSYCLGLGAASNLISSGVSALNVEAFTEALCAAYAGKTPEISPEKANALLQQFFAKQQKEKGKTAGEKGKRFLLENKTREGVTELSSGLQYKVITAGAGAVPRHRDKVRCHYEGRLVNGEVFDSSYRRGTPAEFPVNGVIQGWVEALQIMPAGSKWQLFIPPELAYGSRGAGNSIGPNETLIFDIELLDIV
ncbi:MAG: FKBP-type peptidyl-prolyl cis-trans isomerase [Odoribacteraceae bacterium]|jgi:FKBP-type peptidyl-prolyl cis-trans isomerase FklB|nr:FKBP-type peptidyl-prolyl cis-trans isomerase [Odoribacteraceae bacterium]